MKELHDADWLEKRLNAERERLSTIHTDPRPGAEYAIITPAFARELDDVAVETYIESLEGIARAGGDPMKAREALKRELLRRQSEERHEALSIAQASLKAAERTYTPAPVAAWAGVIAVIIGTVALLIR